MTFEYWQAWLWAVLAGSAVGCVIAVLIASLIERRGKK